VPLKTFHDCSCSIQVFLICQLLVLHHEKVKCE
jgi:hypothetical protein